MSQQTKYKLDDIEFKSQLEELVSITSRLKYYSSSILFMIFLNIIIFVSLGIIKTLCFGGSNYFYKSDYTFFMIIGVFLILFFVGMAVLYLFSFSNQKKTGMIIYDELTEEIDWSNKRKEFIYRPPIEMRMIVKEFLKAGDLPFTSGSNGLAFYFVILLSLIITTVLLFTL